MQPITVQSLFERWGPRYRTWATLTIMLGATAMILATTIVNVAIPDFMRSFGVDQDEAQWLSTGFLAATTATLLLTAWLVGAYGQRAVYLGTLALFCIAAVAGGLSPNAGGAIASRVVQGAAAGVIQPLAMVVLFAVYPEEQRGRAMAAFGLGAVLSPALGPVVGGWLVEHFGWRATFFVAVPFCAAAFALALLFLPSARAAERKRFDAPGFVLLTAALLALLHALGATRHAGGLDAGLALRWAAAAALAVAFIVHERRTGHPLLELAIFANRRFAAAALVAFAYGLGIYGSTYLLPLFVQTVAGYNAFEAGVLLLPAGLVLAATIPLAGRLTDRGAPYHVVIAGLACFAASFWLMAYADAGSGFWTLAAWIVVGRIGLGLIIPALSVGAIQVLELRHVGQGSGVVNFVRQLGGAFGVNGMASFLEYRLAGGGRTEAFQASFGLVAAIFAAAIVAAWFMRKGADR